MANYTYPSSGSLPPAPEDAKSLLETLGEFQVIDHCCATGSSQVFFVKRNDFPNLELTAKVARIDNVKREVKVFKTVHADSLLRYLEHKVDEESELGYILTPALDTQTLDSFLRNETPRYLQKLVTDEGRESLGLMIDICRSAYTLHQHQKVHRDIKPANVGCRKNPTAFPHERSIQCQLFDYDVTCEIGCVAVNNASHSTVSTGDTETSRRGDTKLSSGTEGNLVGTEYYRAPEQKTGVPASEKADLYSIGCLLYSLVAGHQIGHGKQRISEKDLLNDIRHRKVAGLVKYLFPGLKYGSGWRPVAWLSAYCLQHDPKDRPKSAAKVAEHIECILEYGRFPGYTVPAVIQGQELVKHMFLTRIGKLALSGAILLVFMLAALAIWGWSTTSNLKSKIYDLEKTEQLVVTNLEQANSILESSDGPAAIKRAVDDMSLAVDQLGEKTPVSKRTLTEKQIALQVMLGQLYLVSGKNSLARDQLREIDIIVGELAQLKADKPVLYSKLQQFRANQLVEDGDAESGFAVDKELLDYLMSSQADDLDRIKTLQKFRVAYAFIRRNELDNADAILDTIDFDKVATPDFMENNLGEDRKGSIKAILIAISSKLAELLKNDSRAKRLTVSKYMKIADQLIGQIGLSDSDKDILQNAMAYYNMRASFELYELGEVAQAKGSCARMLLFAEMLGSDSEVTSAKRDYLWQAAASMMAEIYVANSNLRSAKSTYREIVSRLDESLSPIALGGRTPTDDDIAMIVGELYARNQQVMCERLSGETRKAFVTAKKELQVDRVLEKLPYLRENPRVANQLVILESKLTDLKALVKFLDSHETEKLERADLKVLSEQQLLDLALFLSSKRDFPVTIWVFDECIDRKKAFDEPNLSNYLFKLGRYHVLSVQNTISGLSKTEKREGNLQAGIDELSAQGVSLILEAVENGYRNRSEFLAEPGMSLIRSRPDIAKALDLISNNK